MKLKKVMFILTLSSMMGLISVESIAANVQQCGGSSTKTGKTYKINGSEISVRSGPGTNFDKLINEKATRILKKTKYITVDNSVTVFEECSQNGWSKIRVTDPDYLSESHRGWVSSQFLRGKKVDASGAEVFTAADFSFDNKTLPYKDIIVSGVNKVHKENARCKKIDPYSAYISSSKGTSSDPVFFVTCGTGANAFNVFFSKSEVEKGSKLTAIKHIDKSIAIQKCEDYAKNNATHPSTVSFSRVMDLSVTEHPNGNTAVMSSFTAKNSYNLELKYNIRCLLNASGLFEANINEAN